MFSELQWQKIHKETEFWEEKSWNVMQIEGKWIKNVLWLSQVLFDRASSNTQYFWWDVQAWLFRVNNAVLSIILNLYSVVPLRSFSASYNMATALQITSVRYWESFVTVQLVKQKPMHPFPHFYSFPIYSEGIHTQWCLYRILTPRQMKHKLKRTHTWHWKSLNKSW